MWGGAPICDEEGQTSAGHKISTLIIVSSSFFLLSSTKSPKITHFHTCPSIKHFVKHNAVSTHTSHKSPQNFTKSPNRTSSLLHLSPSSSSSFSKQLMSHYLSTLRYLPSTSITSKLSVPQSFPST